MPADRIPGDPSRPRAYCVPCDRVRYCHDHLRAESPPAAARAWLGRTCAASGCDIRYRAGIALGGAVVGQGGERG